MTDQPPIELRRTPDPPKDPEPETTVETDQVRAVLRTALGRHADHLELPFASSDRPEVEWRPILDVLAHVLERPLFEAFRAGFLSSGDAGHDGTTYIGPVPQPDPDYPWRTTDDQLLEDFAMWRHRACRAPHPELEGVYCHKLDEHTESGPVWDRAHGAGDLSWEGTPA